MGNICRSPTAHGVFEYLVKQQGADSWIEIDSAGTHAYHVGEQPDRRAQQTALAKGVDLSYIKARQVAPADFKHYDYILAMDSDNYQNLMAICPAQYQHKVKKFLSFASAAYAGTTDVPDPYYGGNKGFVNVFNMVHDASNGLLQSILQQS